MSGYIENFKSASKNRILAFTTKQPAAIIISRSDIEKSSSALHLKNFRKFENLQKKKQFYSVIKLI